MIVKDEKRGTWMVKYYIRGANGKLKSTTKRGFLTKKAAKQFELNVSGMSETPITFFALYKEYIKSLNCSDEEKQTRISYCEKWITFKDRKIDTISKPILNHWNVFMKDGCNLSPTTKNRIIGFVKGTYKYANEVYGVQDISNVLKVFPKEQSEKEVLTVEEFNRMIQFETNPVYYAFFYTAYWTGCRRGELKGLFKEDLSDHAFTIKHTMRLGEDSMKEGNKTTKLHKTVQLDDETYNLLIPLAHRPGKYLFGDDTPLCNETIRRRLKSLCQQADINKNITVHSLRHSHGSILLANGVDIATVSKRLRHSSIRTTLENYIHILDDDGKVTIEAINKIKNTH